MFIKKRSRKLLKKKAAKLVYSAAFLALYSGATQAASMIDTIDAGNTTSIGSMITSSSATDSLTTANTSWGQTFRAPNSIDTQLNDFTFITSHTTGTLNFRAYIAPWDATQNQIIGTDLIKKKVAKKKVAKKLPIGTTPPPEPPAFTDYFASYNITLPTTDSAVPLTTIIEGGLLLQPNTDYIVFFSTSRFAAIPSVPKTSFRHTGNGGDYSNGMLFTNNGLANPIIPDETWTAHNSDLDFSMNFSEPVFIPTPSASLAGILGFGLLNIARRRRRPPP